MRLLSLALAGFSLIASNCLFAELAVTPEETKTQVEFKKAYINPDKEARKMSLATLSNAKHSSSFRMLYGVVSTDPEPDVRQAAFEQLAKAPARDSTVAKMLAQALSGLKNTTAEKDEETLLNYAKALASVEFKADLTNWFVYRLGALRYPDVPALVQGSNGGDNRKQIESIKKQRKFYEDLLEAFNAFAHSEVNSATKDSPKLIKTWFETNAGKIAAADNELATKYRKEDADAAKAAADAAKNK